MKGEHKRESYTERKGRRRRRGGEREKKADTKTLKSACDARTKRLADFIDNFKAAKHYTRCANKAISIECEMQKHVLRN